MEGWRDADARGGDAVSVERVSSECARESSFGRCESRSNALAGVAGPRPMPVRGSRTRGGANTPRPESRAVFPRDVRAQ